jgi:hypothetical protein
VCCVFVCICALQLVFVKPDFSKYTAASAEAFAVFRGYDAAVEGASLDEAYLDVTQHCSATGLTGEQVRQRAAAGVCVGTVVATRSVCVWGGGKSKGMGRLAGMQQGGALGTCIGRGKGQVLNVTHTLCLCVGLWLCKLFWVCLCGCRGTVLNNCFVMSCCAALCAQVAEELRSKVVEATRGLTCSVGVASNMMLAKIASDRNKPNGQFAVAPTREAVLDFIADLPIRQVRCRGRCQAAGIVCVKASCLRCLCWTDCCLAQDHCAVTVSCAAPRSIPLAVFPDHMPRTVCFPVLLMCLPCACPLPAPHTPNIPQPDPRHRQGHRADPPSPRRVSLPRPHHTRSTADRPAV